jgi:hypothetical protein
VVVISVIRLLFWPVFKVIADGGGFSLSRPHPIIYITYIVLVTKLVDCTHKKKLYKFTIKEKGGSLN